MEGQVGQAEAEHASFGGLAQGADGADREQDRDDRAGREQPVADEAQVARADEAERPDRQPADHGRKRQDQAAAVHDARRGDSIRRTLSCSVMRGRGKRPPIVFT